MLSEDVLFLSVTELAKRIRARQLSPVELTESYLDRSLGGHRQKAECLRHAHA